MSEIHPLVRSYSHLAQFPRARDALHILQKVTSLVKPLMRARGWKVGQLTEFYPQEENLLGLNVNRGTKICLRLRFPNDRTLFLPMEQIVDTMLHELSHNVHGPHDGKFHALWNQLRDEHEQLAMKGYTGEGFLSDGNRLGGRDNLPMHEARRLARATAEKRRTFGAGSGQRLGGAAPRPNTDIRRVIVDAVERRSKTLQGCGNEKHDQDEICEIADTATRNGFKTQAEEDAANGAAIAQALWELVQEDKNAKHGRSYTLPTAKNPTGSTTLADETMKESSSHAIQPSTAQVRSAARETSKGSTSAPKVWSCETCTLENPADYLCCDACGAERSEVITRQLTERSSKRKKATIDLTTPGSKPARTAASSSRSSLASYAKSQAKAPVTQTWTCSFCGRVREKQWWSCDMCGMIKESS